MMRSSALIAASLAAILLASCATGVTFRNREDFNLSLSPGMLGVSVFKDTELVKRHLEEIPGYIAIDDGAGNLQAMLPLQAGGYVPAVVPITEDNTFYHSVIDQTAGAQGSYLALLSADLKGESTAEVTITEAAESYIPKDKVPWQEIAHWAKAHPPAPGQKRYYVQGALLATVTKTIYVKVDSSATVDGGAAFGVNGKVYATSKSTQTSKGSYIGTHLLDVDLIAANPPAGAVLGKHAYEITKGRVFDKFTK